MKKFLLFAGCVFAAIGAQAQYYNYPTLKAGENPNGINKEIKATTTVTNGDWEELSFDFSSETFSISLNLNPKAPPLYVTPFK